MNASELSDRDFVEWARTHPSDMTPEDDARIEALSGADPTTEWDAICDIAILHLDLAAALQRAETAERALEEARKQMNTPELHDFATGVVSEAQHQRARFGSGHDAGKEPQDWFWLLGYLAGKALKAHASGDTEKALHHTISSAAVLANWHAHISGTNEKMRPALSEARDEIQRLEGVEDALRNCQMVAAREVRRHDTGKAIKATAMTYAAWKHVLRFCEEAGSVPNLLREDAALNPTKEPPK